MTFRAEGFVSQVRHWTCVPQYHRTQSREKHGISVLLLFKWFSGATNLGIYYTPNEMEEDSSRVLGNL